MDNSQVAQPAVLPVSAPGSIATALPPSLMVLTSIVSAQLGAALAKTLLITHRASSLVLLRTGFAAIALWVVAHPQLRRFSKQHWWHVAGLGMVIAVLSLAFYQAVSRIPLGITMTIEFLGPLMIAVAASRKMRDLLWPVLALAAVLLLAPTGNLSSLSPAGLGFALLAAVAWAGYVVLAKRTTAIFSGASGLTLAMTFAGLSSLPFGLFTAGKSLLDSSLLMNGFWIAMLSTMIPLSLEFLAFKRMSPRTFGILVSADPAVAALIGLLVLHEHLALRAWVALALVSIATFGVMSQDAYSISLEGATAKV